MSEITESGTMFPASGDLDRITVHNRGDKITMVMDDETIRATTRQIIFLCPQTARELAAHLNALADKLEGKA